MYGANSKSIVEECHMITVFLAAGGTGGHITPAYACAKTLHARGERVVWLGTNGPIDQKLLEHAPWECIVLPLVGLVWCLVQPMAMVFTMNE